MILCSGSSRAYRGTPHEEICYQSGSCPLCTALDDIKLLKDEIEALTKEVNDGK